MAKWTREDQARAEAEGWGLFKDDVYGVVIQRVDEARKFGSDADARQHVFFGSLSNPFYAHALQCEMDGTLASYRERGLL